MPFNPVNLQQSDQLAKLLATENITVRRSALAQTASFDLKGRVLTLPILVTSKSKDVADMMTGHEVAHALWTLEADWVQAIQEEKIHKQSLNVVEDARIERKIKRKYPGIVRSFITGYQQLANDNFFGDEKPNLDMPLIDRLNLYAKCGSLAGIPFYDEEYWAVEGLDAVETFEEAKTFAKKLQIDYADSMQQEMHQDMVPGDSEWEDYGGYGEADDDDMEDFDELKSEGDGSPPPTRAAEPDADKFDPETTGDIEDDAFNTEATFEERKKELSDGKSDQPVYFKFPELNLKNTLVTYKECLGLYNQLTNVYDPYGNKGEGLHVNLIEEHASDYNAFRNSSQKVINYMVKEFERKKAASEHRRVSISKTGVLDVNKLHSYKYNEDLFLKKAIMPDGKNHGMIMLLDWSASMSLNMEKTMQQLLNLVWFCQKVNIPFEVYAFSNTYWGALQMQTSPSDISASEYSRIHGDSWKHDVGALYRRGDFALLNFFSSRMRAAEMTKMAKALYAFSKVIRVRTYNLSPWELSSTPLPEALCAMMTIVPNFRNHYKLDKVNLITLTDGEANFVFDGVISATHITEGGHIPRHNIRPIRGYSQQGVYECPITRRVYPVMVKGTYVHEYEAQCRLILTVLRETYGIKTLGIFLDNDSHGKSVKSRVLERYLGWRNYNRDLWARVRKGVKANGFATIATKYCAYDEFYIVPTGNMQIDDGRIGDVPDGITKGKLKTLFAKAQKNKVGSRVLAERLMTLIA